MNTVKSPTIEDLDASHQHFRNQPFNPKQSFRPPLGALILPLQAIVLWMAYKAASARTRLLLP